MRHDRLRSLLAIEIARIVDDLEKRRDFLLKTWSKHRDRQPFLDTVFNRWKTVGFPDLVDLEPDEVAAVDGFFRKVDEFRLYMAYTQDMPVGLADRYDFMVERMRAWGELAIDALGGAPVQPEVMDAELREGFLLAFPEGLGGEEGDESVTADGSAGDTGAEDREE